MSWLSCVSFILEQICGQKTTVDIPFEIMMDILIRLPAETLFLCGHECKPLGALVTSASFADTYLIQTATPVIAFHHYLQYLDCDRKVQSRPRTIKVYLMDELSQNVVTKSVKMDLVPTFPNAACDPFVLGSYNGFFMFTNYSSNAVLLIWNPVTQEEVSVVAPNPRYQVRGLYFHKATQEYRLLYISLDVNFSFRYYILSLRTKCTRRIKNYPHPPSGVRSPIVLNDVLHWVICDKFYKTAHFVYPSCSDSILLFDVTSEEFSSLPHPGGQCLGKNLLERKHLAMKLMEIEGQLCLCDLSSYNEIVMWILEDYDKKIWAKMYVLTEPLKKFPQTRSDVLTVKVVHIFNDIVLLNVKCKEMVLYNIKSGTFRRFGKLYAKYVSAVRHVNTFAAIHTDDTVYLSIEEKATKI